MINDYTHRPATPDDLEQIWAKNIADNPGDERWIAWRDNFIQSNLDGKSKTFVTLYRGTPIGEGTLLLLSECIQGRTDLADGSIVVNLNALRMDKRHEGKGHMSRLVKLIEQHAADLGYKKITIGVAPRDTRPLAIYLYWGYDTLVRTDYEEDGELVLYYAKNL
ncbi:MAG: GNAT family N-acetyltransferase [Oscillospiraceae bacterium]|nr:GNAT family N-acetyltransferase [Oscillospiraceae bacterium]